MNRNFLLKDELQYELSARGISSDSDVQTLRKLFRSVEAEEVQVDLLNLSTQCVEDLYECVVNKTLQMQALITQQKSELALLTPRFRTRLSHLRGRLLHLTELDRSASGIATSKYQQVRDRLHNIEIILAKMDVADRTGKETEEGDDTSNTTQEEVSAQDNSSPDETQERQDTGRVSNVTRRLMWRSVRWQVTPSEQGIKQVFTPHF